MRHKAAESYLINILPVIDMLGIACSIPSLDIEYRVFKKKQVTLTVSVATLKINLGTRKLFSGDCLTKLYPKRSPSSEQLGFKPR